MFIMQSIVIIDLNEKCEMSYEKNWHTNNLESMCKITGIRLRVKLETFRFETNIDIDIEILDKITTDRQ